MYARYKHLALITDAWPPQINGVVRTLQAIIAQLECEGWQVSVLHPGDFRCIPCPGYPQIPVAVNPWPLLTRKLNALKPDYIHIASEATLGLTARLWCAQHGYNFTTSYHTRFAEYLYEHIRVPRSLGYRAQKWFHNGACATLVPSPSLKRDLDARGFRTCRQWSHGVDTEAFHPSYRTPLDLPRPIQLYVGRISLEKNIEAFLSLDTPGTKLVVGDGPILKTLQAQYPQAVFVGEKHGKELSCLYASADVFVFPSRTDTFGLVLLEALASGTPIAAFPVFGPIDLVGDAKVGALNEDLKVAIARALLCSRTDCRRFAEQFSWEETARLFAEALTPVKEAVSAA
jgi:glycosyltransferase involved in cell wall biosynthesis